MTPDTEGSSNDEQPKITLRDLLVHEIQEHVKISKELQEIIKNSKTKPKRDLYTKKIRKNNEQVAELLLALQRLDNNAKQKVIKEAEIEQPKQDNSELA